MTSSYSIIETLILSFNSIYKDEIISDLRGLVKIHQPYELNPSVVYDKYSTHFYIQQNITKHNNIEGWDKLLPELESICNDDKENVILFDMVTERYGYLIFTRSNVVIGILRFNKLKIIKSQEINTNGVLKGIWNDNTKFYLNGNECVKK